MRYQDIETKLNAKDAQCVKDSENVKKSISQNYLLCQYSTPSAL